MRFPCVLWCVCRWVRSHHPSPITHRLLPGTSPGGDPSGEGISGFVHEPCAGFFAGLVAVVQQPCWVPSFGLVPAGGPGLDCPAAASPHPGGNAPASGHRARHHLSPGDLWFPWLCLRVDILVCSEDTRVR